MPNARRAFFELAGATALVTLLCWTPLFFVIFVDRDCAVDEAPAAFLLQLKDAYQDGPWALLPTLAVFALLAWRAALPALEGRSWRRKLVVIGGAFALQAALVFGIVAGQLALDPHWLFGHTRPTVHEPSPDGRRTAHAALSCFLGCSWHVYVHEQGALKMKRVHTEPAGKNEDDKRAQLVWSVDSRDVSLRRSP
jgi:hypothetical protein